MPVTATAYDIKTQNLLYTERFALEGDTVISHYFDDTDQLFATKSVSATQSTLVPEYDLIDHRRNITLGVKAKADQYIMFKHKQGKKKAKQKVLKAKHKLLVDLGFNFWVHENWQALTQGDEALLFDFPFVEKMLLVRMHIQQTPCKQVNAEHICFKMAPQNIFLRRLAGSTQLVFNRHTKRLLRFVGTCYIGDEKGRPFKADIRYEYAALQ